MSGNTKIIFHDVMCRWCEAEKEGGECQHWLTGYLFPVRFGWFPEQGSWDWDGTSVSVGTPSLSS